MRTTENQRTTALPSFAPAMEGGQEHKTTQPKKWFLMVGVLSVVLLAAVPRFSQEVHGRQPSDARSLAAFDRGHPEVMVTRVAGAGRGFGPVFEARLPAAGRNGETKLLDLETGRWLTLPGLERFNENVGAMMSWIRTNGLNISCRVWPDGSAGCVTYNMTVVPVETTCWEEAATADIPGILVPGFGHHSPSRLLVLGPDRTDTYVFRTDEGTLGMLRLVGLSDDERVVKIRYKLLVRDQRAEIRESREG
jgi:hypothetical protein